MTNQNPTPNPAQPAAPAGGAASKPVLVEETPLGLSAEQMTKSNPEAVQAIRAEGAKADRERLAALQAAFPDDAAFALEAFGAGQSVAEAKAARYDTLAPQIKALREENATLKTAVESGKVKFSYQAKEGANGGDKSQTEATAADKLWDASEKLRSEFGGKKELFLADYKRHPEEYAS